MGEPDHRDFDIISHTRFLEIFSESTVYKSNGGKVLHAAESEILELGEEGGDVAEGVGGADAGEDTGVVYYGEDFGGLC